MVRQQNLVRGGVAYADPVGRVLDCRMEGFVPTNVFRALTGHACG